MTPDGRLRRTDGDSQNGAQGFLDDYSHLIDGLLALHAADGDLRWLIEAEKLTRQAVALFWDPLQSRFYDTGSDQQNLIIRPRDVTDNALPSGHSMMTGVLIRLSIITGDADLRTIASDSLRSVRDIMIQFPTGAGHWLSVLDFYLSDHKEAVIITPPSASSPDAGETTPSTPTDTPAPTVIPASQRHTRESGNPRRGSPLGNPPLANNPHRDAPPPRLHTPSDQRNHHIRPPRRRRRQPMARLPVPRHHRQQAHRLHLPQLRLPTPHHQPRHHAVPAPQLTFNNKRVERRLVRLPSP